jgi:hypothetical protein
MNRIVRRDPLQLESFLEKYSLKLPVIEEYSKNSLEIKLINESYYLYLNSEQWMIFSPKSGIQLFEFFSHYNLSRGTVICTGMGFLLRESWILTNPDVKRLIVIENSKDLIDYHKEKNPEIFNLIEVIHGDASDFELECDCLLLDHFELQDHNTVINEVIKISKKIKHKVLWFWPLEKIILSETRKNSSGFIDYYNSLREETGILTLPELTKDELENFIIHYFNPKSMILY